MTEPFSHFFDDASTFPPGLAAPRRAVAEHEARRVSAVGAYMGPLVLAAPSAAETLAHAARPITVSLVGDVDTVRSAVTKLGGNPLVTVSSVELKDVSNITDAAMLKGDAQADVYVELAADQTDQLRTLSEHGLYAKFRTGGITGNLYPSVDEVANFLMRAASTRTPFKLTAGLHRAIRYTNVTTGITHHGFLNLANATLRALRQEGCDAVADAVTSPDPSKLRDVLLDDSWRSLFRSFGTCSTSEPLQSLATLGLVDVAVANASQEKAMPIQNEKTAADTYATAGFGIENLPYGSYRIGDGSPRLGVRLGSQVLDAGALASAAGRDDLAPVLDTENLDALLAAGPQTWRTVRSFLQEFLTSEVSKELPEGSVNTVEAVEMLLPFTPADYVDFYASEHHATNVGHIFRPNEAPLKPNWHHLPIGYHGRSSTLFVSGTDIVRPKGLLPTKPGEAPVFGDCQRLDIEAEMGYVVGGSAPRGEVTLEDAKDYIFGLTLVNDWSARDIQNFEYVPLGPFLGKSFATSLGAWVVPLDALQAARVKTPERVHPLAHYLDDSQTEPWNFDVTLTVSINGEAVSHPPMGQMYFSAAQMLAHMGVNGATISVGDFFASGTISGPDKNQRGSFLELAWGGEEPLTLTDGTQMTFLQDGQEVTITATAPGPNGSLIDFGAVTGRILPAVH